MKHALSYSFDSHAAYSNSNPICAVITQSCGNKRQEQELCHKTVGGIRNKHDINDVNPELDS